jgi:polysaccharide export outer membrane protein
MHADVPMTRTTARRSSQRFSAASGSAAFILATLVTTVALNACAWLPTSGPSRSQVQAVAGAHITIVDVDAAVARRLLERRVPEPFSAVFAGEPVRNDLVSSGDVVEVAIWEAPPAVLFTSAAPTGVPAAGSMITPSNATIFPQQMVGTDGLIFIPFAGPIMAAGKTVTGIAAEVTARLAQKANRPQVLVRLISNNTAYATIVGEVASSTRMPLTPRRERLLDGLASAGGTRQPIDKVTLQVTRGERVHALPLGTVIRDPRQNIPLQAGDVVTALYQSSHFTALGAAGKSDEINFESQGISLAQALARVGGVIDTRANAEGVFIFRLESDAAAGSASAAGLSSVEKRPVIYRINLKDPRTFFVAQTFPMADDDVLYVANAPAAELQKFLNLLLTTVYPIEGAVTLTK